jgi:hypothetical protein
MNFKEAALWLRIMKVQTTNQPIAIHRTVIHRTAIHRMIIHRTVTAIPALTALRISHLTSLKIAEIPTKQGVLRQVPNL